MSERKSIGSVIGLGKIPSRDFSLFTLDSSGGPAFGGIKFVPIVSPPRQQGGSYIDAGDELDVYKDQTQTEGINFTTSRGDPGYIQITRYVAVDAQPNVCEDRLRITQKWKIKISVDEPITTPETYHYEGTYEIKIVSYWECIGGVVTKMSEEITTSENPTYLFLTPPGNPAWEQRYPFITGEERNYFEVDLTQSPPRVRLHGEGTQPAWVNLPALGATLSCCNL